VDGVLEQCGEEVIWTWDRRSNRRFDKTASTGVS